MELATAAPVGTEVEVATVALRRTQVRHTRAPTQSGAPRPKTRAGTRQVVPVSAGNAFTPIERHEIDRAIRDAERLSGRDFYAHVGRSAGDSRRTALALHSAVAQPASSILIHVDPTQRSVEIVTGADVRETVDDRHVALAGLSMQTAFEAGDFTRGLLAVIQQLAELARPVRNLHTDTP